MFPDVQACTAYLTRIRWPEGFICPSCGVVSTPWNQSRHRLVCPACRQQTTVTAATIFNKTRTPLTTWFEAAWHVTTAKNGMSAQPLERTLGARYRVAWTMLQRFRVAMVNANANRCRARLKWMKHWWVAQQRAANVAAGVGKSVVVIAVEIKQPKGFGRVRMRHVRNASSASLLPFVRDVVAPGAVVHTDGWNGYNGLPEYGYTRKGTVLLSSGDPAHVSMPGVHRVASLLKGWILGTRSGVRCSGPSSILSGGVYISV